MEIYTIKYDLILINYLETKFWEISMCYTHASSMQKLINFTLNLKRRLCQLLIMGKICQNYSKVSF